MHATRAFGSIAVLTATALLAAGCGSSSKSSNAGSGTASVATGGTLTAQDSAFPDALDPAISGVADGLDSLWTSYTPLLTYPHKSGAAGSEPVPGLATAMPVISADGKTYTLQLRPGLKYSDGTPVKASDFLRTIQRVLFLKSYGAPFFEGIEGAKAYESGSSKTAPIKGIVTDDATGKITINLTAADPQFTYKLASDYAGVVPGNAPFSDQTNHPLPGTGAFEITDVVHGQKWSLVRNPHFNNLPNVPAAKADRINFTIVANQTTQAKSIVDNSVDFIYAPTGPEPLRILRTGAVGRFGAFTTNATDFFFLNQKIAPFNNIQARQAINYAVNKLSIAKLYAGLVTPTCNFLPPGMVGFQKIEPCPYGEPGSAPNLAKAKQLVQASGTAGQKVAVYTDTEATTSSVAAYITDVLNQLGYKASTKSVDSADYFSTIGNASTGAQIGYTGWAQDYPHPSDFFQLLQTSSIVPTNSNNPGNVSDPVMDAKIAAANKAVDVNKVAGQYADIDKYNTDKAYTLNYGVAKLAVATSDRVAFNAIVFHPVYDTDLTSLGLKASN